MFKCLMKRQLVSLVLYCLGLYGVLTSKAPNSQMKRLVHLRLIHAVVPFDKGNDLFQFLVLDNV
jgi:hypothetical protein